MAQGTESLGCHFALSRNRPQLVSWKKYRVQLNRVDTSTVPDIDWPPLPSD
ncbi:tail fiber assembly protein [Enterobacter roggenkampii]|uniref:tail fiber assembly protein n=1 Tax=Enterobacter roggenkampii TaxID=1812935 RepID=UPI00388D2B0B